MILHHVISTMYKKFIIPILTTIGVLVGGSVWLVVYDLNHTSTIGFDGPASGTLWLSIITGGFIFGILSILYEVRRKRTSFLRALPIFLASGLVSCVLVGLVIGKYSLSRYSYAPTEPTDSYAQ